MRAANSPPLSTSTALAAFALLLCSGIAYVPVLGAGFVWDDHLVSENPLLRSLQGLVAIWLRPGELSGESHYWPLTYTTFWIEHQLWGTAPLGYHLTNLLLHALNAVLLWQLLRRLQIPAAWGGALLFALHPVHVESVAWVIERKDVLSAAFYLGACALFLTYLERGSRRSYLLALAAAAAALLSKSVAVSLPGALVLIIWWREQRLGRGRLLAVAPFAGLTAVLVAADLWFVRQHPTIDSGLAGLDRLSLAGSAFWFYAGKLLLPLDLSALYPRWQVQDAGLLGLVPPLLALLTLWGAWALRPRVGRGPFAALLFYGLTLGPVLGLIDFNFMRLSFVADRFQYLASAAPLAGIAAAVLLAQRRWLPGKPRAVLPLVLVAALGLGTLTWFSSQRFTSMETLFRHTIRVNPEAWAAHAFVGYSLNQKGRFGEAARRFERAIEIKSDDVKTLNNYAAALHGAGDVSGAESQLRRALAISDGDSMTLVNLGRLVEQRGELDAALAWYRQALAQDASSASAQYHLGQALAAKGEADEALRQLRALVDKRRSHVAARLALAQLLLQSGARNEAVSQLREALAWDPSSPEAHTLLGNALGQAGQVAQALEHHARAAKLAPEDGNAQFNLAADLARLGRLDEARQGFVKAVQLEPKYAQLMRSQATQLAQAGQLPPALLFCDALLLARPEDGEVAVSCAGILEAAGLGERAAALRQRAPPATSPAVDAGEGGEDR